MWGFLLILGAAIVGVALLSGGDAEASRVRHVVGKSGWVEAEPRALAGLAGVSDSIYALASLMASEAAGEKAQIAVGWAIRNEASRRGESVFRLLTRAGRNDPGTRTFIAHESDGFFAPQNVGPRWASTRKPPTEMTLNLAARVLTDAVDDPTGGATQFDAPGAQDSFIGKVEGYIKTAQQIAEERSKGSTMVMIPGVDSIRFWVPKDA
jgi:hypothetical protein